MRFTTDDKIIICLVVTAIIAIAIILIFVHYSILQEDPMLKPLTYLQKSQLPKVKIDLLSEMDRIIKECPDMAAHEIRSKIGNIFADAARAAGWGFYHIWPVLNEAVETSLNIPGKDEEDRIAEEIIAYITHLQSYCM